LFGRAFSYSFLGNKRLLIQLPDGQRRVVPRSSTDLEGEEDHKLTTSLPKISIRTILPVALLVKAKLATEENQHELASGPSGNRKDIGKATNASRADSEAMETTHSPRAKTAGKTLGETPATDATIPRSGQGGAGC
jgi:hypothetical protein